MIKKILKIATGIAAVFAFSFATAPVASAQQATRPCGSSYCYNSYTTTCYTGCYNPRPTYTYSTYNCNCYTSGSYYYPTATGYYPTTYGYSYPTTTSYQQNTVGWYPYGHSNTGYSGYGNSYNNPYSASYSAYGSSGGMSGSYGNYVFSGTYYGNGGNPYAYYW
ncbi:MAG TPA: hypothetical protein PK950_01915 [Candidatus Paceibacterota bacterium]|nr:hypothetical protein [Candidatus Paceibacterota bacterium]